MYDYILEVSNYGKYGKFTDDVIMCQKRSKQTYTLFFSETITVNFGFGVLLLVICNITSKIEKRYGVNYDNVTILDISSKLLVISFKDNPKILCFRATGDSTCNIELNVDFDYCLQSDHVIIT